MVIAATAITAGAAAAEAAGPQQPAAVADPAQPAGNPQQQPGAAPTGPVDPGQEYLNAFTGVAGAFANDSTVGRVIGTAAGVVIGCPLGAVTGGTLTLAMPALTPVGAIGGCIIGAGTLGFFGGLAGSIISGSPATVTALGEQYNSLHAKGLIAAPGPDAAGAQ
jgi:hypothetical protein